MQAFFNHLNPAVIKNIMLKMDKQEFVQCAQFIKTQAAQTPPGTKREMYMQLYFWCKTVYQQKSNGH